MRTRAAGFADGAEFHASSRRDRIRGLPIWRIRVWRIRVWRIRVWRIRGSRTPGAFAVEAGTTAKRQRAPAHHAHRDLPAHQAGQLIDGQAGVSHRVQGGPGERQHGRSRLGQPDRTAGTVE